MRFNYCFEFLTKEDEHFVKKLEKIYNHKIKEEEDLESSNFNIETIYIEIIPGEKIIIAVAKENEGDFDCEEQFYYICKDYKEILDNILQAEKELIEIKKREEEKTLLINNLFTSFETELNILKQEE